MDFALNLTSSPLMAYLVLASICDLCGAKTGLYKRIKSHRRITRSLGAFIVPLWLILTGVVCLSTSAFTNDDDESEDYISNYAINLFQLIFPPAKFAWVPRCK